MRKLRYLTALLLLPLTLCACGANPAQEQKEMVDITLGEVAHSIFYAPQYAALSQGFFAEEGLNVELINLNGADKVMTALISDEIQVGLMGPEASIYVANQDSANYAVNFAQLTQRDGSFLVGREPIEDFDFTKVTGEILGGRLGGVPEMTLEYVLKTNGLDIGVDDPAKAVNVRTDIQFAAMAGSFLAGEADFVTLFEPTATAIQNEGKGYILASVGEYSGYIPYTAYSASKSYIDTNPEVIQAFTNAVYKGQQYILTADTTEAAEAIQAYFTDMTLEDIIIVIEQYRAIDAWCSTPYFEQDGLEKLMDIMALAGQLDKRANFDKIVDNTFALNAVK